ncbi:MAG: hypothetical protein P4L10_08245 [Acidobacteriaceae bacterium]|nr:hypothetical protein [Acidobacteriaceae bacterium]
MSPEQIGNAIAVSLNELGDHVGRARITLPGKVFSSSPDPSLSISSIATLHEGDAKKDAEPRSALRMVCRQPSTCVPFYVIVSWPVDLKLIGRHPGVKEMAAATTKVNVVMHAGSRATLMLDDDRLHIRIMVMSLSDGAAGSSVCVITPDRKQHYVAQIISADLLQGSL